MGNRAKHALLWR